MTPLKISIITNKYSEQMDDILLLDHQHRVFKYENTSREFLTALKI